MIVDATNLKAAIKQCIEEVNDACLDLRGQGLQVMLPEFVDFEVQLVTDLNSVSRTETGTEADGSSVTLVEQVSEDTDTTVKSGGDTQTVRSPGAGTETTTISHPGVQTSASGADNSDETVTYTYED